jgi:peptide/nickel transport system permease protein
VSVTEAPSAPVGLPALEADLEAPRRGGRRRRLLFSYLLTAFVLVTLNFFLPRILPGDPIGSLVAGAQSGRGSVEISADARAKLAHYYGLDRSLPSQYWHYLSGLAHGDLGTSVRYNRPVSELIRERARWSIQLIVASIAIATGLGMITGIHSGWRRGHRLDRGLLGVLVAIGNFPVFVLASFALILFGVKLHWFPFAGGQTPFVHYSALHRLVDVLHHLALPATVMAIQFLFLLFLVMRGSMVSELGSDHLRLGRAKGLSERRLKYAYAARNALVPAVTIVALDIGIAIGTSVFVERVFAYPGLGRLMFDAIDFRDYPTMQGCFLVISLMVLTVNLVTDLVYPRLDPRIER